MQQDQHSPAPGMQGHCPQHGLGHPPCTSPLPSSVAGARLKRLGDFQQLCDSQLPPSKGHEHPEKGSEELARPSFLPPTPTPPPPVPHCPPKRPGLQQPVLTGVLLFINPNLQNQKRFHTPSRSRLGEGKKRWRWL